MSDLNDLPEVLGSNGVIQKQGEIIPYDVPTFPVEVFPKPLRKMMEETAEAINCPTDFLGIPLIVNIGTAIGTTREIQVKKGWEEGARFYAGVVAEPGSKKSPALEQISRPIMDKQEKYYNEYEQLEKEYETDCAAYEEEMENYKKEKDKKRITKPEKPKRPVMKQNMSTDATVEALAELLENNPRGLTFHRDELTGWVNEMDQYKGGKGSDREKWLSFWNGSEVVVNRKERKGKPTFLKNPLVNVIGAIAPDKLDTLAGDGKEDGFIHRILFSFPITKDLKWTDKTVNQQTIDDFNKVFDDLFRLEPRVNENGKPEPMILSFTEEGKATWVDWIEEHYSEQSKPDFPYKFKYPWAKLEGYAARLALILHISRYVCGEAKTESVDEISMIGAAALIDYFKGHCKKVYARLKADPNEQRLMRAAEWIKKEGGRVKARDVYRNKVAGTTDADEAKLLFRQLESRKAGKVEEKGKGSFVFTLNPPDR